MRYYLDTEFDGMGGDLISLALVREDCTLEYVLADRTTAPVIQRRRSLYLVTKGHARDPWVKDNVIPILDAVPDILTTPSGVVSLTLAEYLPIYLDGFFEGDDDVEVIADWPDDIGHLCKALITGPGTMIEVRPRIRFTVERVDAYPTDLPGAVQHNAWWDAMALRHHLLAHAAA